MTKKKRNYITIKAGSTGKAKVCDLEFSVGIYDNFICVIPVSIPLISLLYLMHRYPRVGIDDDKI